MHSRSTLTRWHREQLVQLFSQGWGYRAAASQVGVGVDPVKNFHERWRLRGMLCLMDKPTKSVFSFEVKKEVVDRHVAGESAMDLAMEFDLSSPAVVRTWVSAWRRGGDDALRPKPRGRPRGSTMPVVVSEEEHLRKENKRLRAEVAYLKKLRDLRGQGHA